MKNNENLPKENLNEGSKEKGNGSTNGDGKNNPPTNEPENSRQRNNKRRQKDSKATESKFGEAGTITFNNIALLNKALIGALLKTSTTGDNAPEVKVKGGTSCVHVAVNVEALSDNAFELTEGILRQFITATLSSLGYSTDITVQNSIYENLKVLIRRSAVAYSLLLKMWQIQNGCQVADVANRPYGAVLFRPCMVQAWRDERKTSDGTSSIFQVNLGNAAWQQNYVDRLQYVYLTPEMRSFLQTLFAPIREITKGYSGTTSYLNIWPDHKFATGRWDGFGSEIEGAVSIQTDFENVINDIIRITSEDPVCVKVLTAMGATTGSEFNFSRDLSQRSIFLLPDNGFADILVSIAEPEFQDSLLETDERDILAQFLYLDDETPEAVDSTVSMDMVTVINALRGLVSARSYNFSVANQYDTSGGGSSAYEVIVQPFLMNTHFYPDKYDYETKPALSKSIGEINQRGAAQRARTDLSAQFVHNVFIKVDNANPYGDTFEIYSGYGTFVMDKASLNLARWNSATALIFGADYKTKFAEKINSIPGNNIKFK